MSLTPRMVRNIKTLFHALTVASTTLAAIGGVGGMIPAKYALYIALGTSAISGLLNLMTRFFPWLATEDESDDPPSEDVPDKVEPPVPATDPYYPTAYLTLTGAKAAGRKGDTIYQHPTSSAFYLFPQFGTPYYSAAISDNKLNFVTKVS